MSPPPRRPTNPWTIVLIVVGACGGIALVGVAVLAAILFPVFAQARESARKTACMSNVKILSLAVMMYAQDNDERLPLAANWQTSVTPYAQQGQTTPRRVDTCGARAETVPAYAFNRQLNSAKLWEIEAPNTTPVIFESSLGEANGSDLLESFVTPHRNQGLVGFLDGSARAEDSAPPNTPAGATQ